MRGQLFNGSSAPGVLVAFHALMNVGPKRVSRLVIVPPDVDELNARASGTGSQVLRFSGSRVLGLSGSRVVGFSTDRVAPPLMSLRGSQGESTQCRNGRWARAVSKCRHSASDAWASASVTARLVTAKTDSRSFGRRSKVA